jgi:hypothetical protein
MVIFEGYEGNRTDFKAYDRPSPSCDIPAEWPVSLFDRGLYPDSTPVDIHFLPPMGSWLGNRY